MAKTGRDAEAVLARIRKGKERQETLPEYGEEVAQKERAWFAREKGANDQALRRMRALCPVGITSLTVQGLEQQAMEAGSLYPRQLSRRLKVYTGLMVFSGLCSRYLTGRPLRLSFHS
ncbi:unnamed protein product [Ascophyllum nodosum]